MLGGRAEHPGSQGGVAAGDLRLRAEPRWVPRRVLTHMGQKTLVAGRTYSVACLVRGGEGLRHRKRSIESFTSFTVRRHARHGRKVFIMTSTPPVDIGIDETERLEIAAGLSRLLADSYTLYLKTHKYHWNVTGPMFQTLHVMFEQQYTELALAVDLIAERIRALGAFAPGSYEEFGSLASLAGDDATPDATEMVRRLLDGQECVVRTARSIFPIVERAHDEPTADLLTQRMQVHEKTAWMLRSLLA
jgi:starvation-inducible DNA-binding protein